MAVVDQQKDSVTGLDNMEILLGRIILRLTMATSGLDPNLDPLLRSLRNAVRKGIQPNSLELLSEISEKLVRAESDDEFVPQDPEGALLDHLISRSPLKGDELDHLRTLGEKLNSTSSPLRDTDLDEFLGLLIPSVRSVEKTGFFSRIFSGRPESVDTHATPNDALRSLLEKIEWPGQIEGDVEVLASQLSAKSPDNQWESTLARLVSILSTALGAVRSEIRATEGFLSELHLRLNEIDRYVNQGKERRNLSLDGGLELGAGVGQNVNEIRNGIREAKSLDQLRSGIDKQLGSIATQVESFVQAERARHQEAEAAERKLKRELESVESEAQDLRRKVVEVHRQAATDSVTGLPNRMAYEERLSQEFARWKRFGEPLCMLVWDVDDFKSINDRFGHQSGDKALRIIAQMLRSQLRETDFVARFGGEEFVMLLAGSSLEDTITQANKIRTAVSAGGFHSGGSKVSVTISCGIGEFVGGDTPDTVFSRADNALYEAKKLGKDRVIGS